MIADPRLILCQTFPALKECDLKSQCQTGQFCCPSDCGGTQCYSPAQPGKCPPAPKPEGDFCMRIRFANCEETKCPAGQVCCPNGCPGVNTCQAPDPKPCPPSNNPACPALKDPSVIQCLAGPQPFECDSTKPCKAGQYCCPTDCGGTQCYPKDHPGTCPPTDPNIITTCEFIEGVNCIDDSECAPTEKCCNPGGCGRRCISVNSPSGNPGKCPAVVPIDKSFCERERFAVCKDDSACADTSQKCCLNGCGVNTCQTAQSIYRI